MNNRQTKSKNGSLPSGHDRSNLGDFVEKNETGKIVSENNSFKQIKDKKENSQIDPKGNNESMENVSLGNSLLSIRIKSEESIPDMRGNIDELVGTLQPGNNLLPQKNIEIHENNSSQKRGNSFTTIKTIENSEKPDIEVTSRKSDFKRDSIKNIPLNPIRFSKNIHRRSEKSIKSVEKGFDYYNEQAGLKTPEKMVKIANPFHDNTAKFEILKNEKNGKFKKENFLKNESVEISKISDDDTGAAITERETQNSFYCRMDTVYSDKPKFEKFENFFFEENDQSVFFSSHDHEKPINFSSFKGIEGRLDEKFFDKKFNLKEIFETRIAK